jgi:phosphatidylserine decarboxylase
MFSNVIKLKIVYRIVISLTVILLLSSCQLKCQANSSYKTEKKQPLTGKHELITEQLITTVEHSPELKKLLLSSIEMAKKSNPDKITNPAQSLEEYYEFIDWAAKAMPWTILKDTQYSSLYEQTYQGLTYFYFINDQPLPELENKGYFRNSLQYHEPYRSWLILFTRDWGIYLSKEDSWNEEYYKKVLADDTFGFKNDWYESSSNWKSFNDFFSRHLKSPDVRPIAFPNDSSIVTAPADSRSQGVWKIDSNSNIINKKGVIVKSVRLKSMSELLGNKCPYKNAFADGTFTHMFLDVNDYHRYHFPVAGTIKDVCIIEEDDAVGGTVNWDTESGKYLFDAASPGWQNVQTRGLVIIDTDKYGLVGVLPVGMSQVSSIKFEENIRPGTVVKKGAPLGYFLFGGSDIILLFQDKVNFKLLH